jgi:hypothetical protein
VTYQRISGTEQRRARRARTRYLFVARPLAYDHAAERVVVPHVKGVSARYAGGAYVDPRGGIGYPLAIELPEVE